MSATRPVSAACRTIVDAAPASGRWNMAVDEALLETAVAQADVARHSGAGACATVECPGSACTVRWYQWDVATLSLGYFQSPQDARRDPFLTGLPIVRRLSGGGAIVHHHELTYSCTIPASHPWASRPRELYAAVHERMIAVLAGFGIDCALRGRTQADARQAFLCFGRGDDFDVVLGRHKVLGSAQRRRKGAILQHGSLVLAASEFAPGFPGVLDLADRDDLTVADLVEAFSSAVGGLFGATLEFGDLTPQEAARAAELAASDAEFPGDGRANCEMPRCDSV
jgi:lipoate-protein ligase A